MRSTSVYERRSLRAQRGYAASMRSFSRNQIVLTAALVMSAVLGAGCQNKKVSVEITAGETGTTRTFATNEKDSEALARVSNAYGNDGQADAGLGRSFTGTFAENALPSEIGNRGALGTAKSSLGTTSVYLEQFAARRDEWAAFKNRVESGVLWTQILGKFLESRKITDDATRETFHQWWNAEIVPLAADLYLMYSGMQAVVQAQRIGAKPRKRDDLSPRTSDEAFRMEVFEPLALLLVERGWVNADELTLLHAATVDGSVSTREGKWISEHIIVPAGTRIARRFDPTLEEKSLEKLAPIGLEFLLWVKFSREYKDLVLASDAIPQATKNAIKAGVWDFELPPPFGFRIATKPKITEALVKLNTNVEPFFTNGRYDALAEQTIFDGDFYEAAFRYAPYNAPYYAMWSLPSQRQESLFGKVILEADALAAYCIWEIALDDETRTEWQAATEALATTSDATKAYDFLKKCMTQQPLPRPLAEWIANHANQPLPAGYDATPMIAPAEPSDEKHPPAAAGV